MNHCPPAGALARARDRAVDLVRALDLGAARDRAVDLVHDLERDLDLGAARKDAHDLVLDLNYDRDRTHAHAYALGRAHNLDLALALALDRALDCDRGSGYDRTHDLDRSHVRAHVQDLKRAHKCAVKLLRALDRAQGVGSSMPGPVSRRVLVLASRMLPAPERPRYREECRAELSDLPCQERLRYALRVLVGAWELRRVLTGVVRTPDGSPARRAER